jgi:hypothetical protein
MGFELEKYHMKQFLSVCYVVLIVAINVTGFRGDLKIQGYPLWMLIFSIVATVPGLIAVLLWAFEFGPKRKWFWRIVLFALVFYFAADWYFEFVIYRPLKPDLTNQLLVVVTLIGLLLFYPLIYSTFKFGFGDQE